MDDDICGIRQLLGVDIYVIQHFQSFETFFAVYLNGSFSLFSQHHPADPYDLSNDEDDHTNKDGNKSYRLALLTCFAGGSHHYFMINRIVIELFIGQG